MDGKQLYLEGCIYAISKMREKGSYAYSALIAHDQGAKWKEIPWNEITEWLREELKNVESTD